MLKNLIRLPALLALAAVALAVVGCSREAAPEPIVDRTKDPAYQAKLKGQLQEQREIVKRASAVVAELEAARAEDPESEKTKALEKRHAEMSVELEKNRQVSMAIIRDRMKQELDDRQQVEDKHEKK